MSATLTHVSEPLWQIEEHLDALLNSVDLCETEEQRLEIMNEIASQYMKRGAKADQMDGWLNRETAYVMSIDQQMDRLKKLREKRLRAVSKVEDYIASVMLANGMKRLDGNKCRFTLKKNPPSVEITNDFSIPTEYESVTLQYDPEQWAQFINNVPVAVYDDYVRHYIKERKPSKSRIKKALDSGRTIPGAQYAPPKYRLERE